ncbi:hypothetical protein ACHAW6_005398 [Cyclotella cf. meneghiniana]
MSDMKALVDAVDAVTSRKRDHGDLAFSSDGFTAAAPKRGRKSKKGDLPREKRLEQNRLAASESRRRKKEMVEELQRSVAFFSKANISLKSQNAELERQILLAKQRILAGEKGIPSNTFEAEPAPSLGMETASSQRRSGGEYAKNDLSGLLKTSCGVDVQQAQAAHFAATQAMYKSMGFPPGAARAAATTLSQYVGQTGKLPGTPNAENSESGLMTNDMISLLKAPQPVDDKQAQAAHFAATQALYKSMGFPPGAARAAASTFSQCSTGKIMPAIKTVASDSVSSSLDVLTQNPKKNPNPTSMNNYKPRELPQQANKSESYVEALNKFAMQQAVAANAAAAAASAAIQAAKFHSQQQSARPVPSLPPMITSGLHFPFPSAGGFIGGVSLGNFLSQSQGGTSTSVERKN